MIRAVYFEGDERQLYDTREGLYGERTTYRIAILRDSSTKLTASVHYTGTLKEFMERIIEYVDSA